MSDDPLSEPRLPKPSRWKRLQQRSLPEVAWINEQKTLAGMDAAQRRAWIKRLCSGNKFIRQEASRSFQGLPSVARRLLTVQAYQRALAQQGTLGASAACLTLSIVAACASAGAGWLAFGFGIVLMITGLLTVHLRDSRLRELAQDLLDQTQDPCLVPYLLTRMHQNSVNNRAPRQVFGGRNIRNALARLLPLVQEGDVVEWTGTHWNYLLYYLRHPHEDVEITLLTLNFVARFGNEQALRAVEALTRKQINLEHAATIGSAREALEANRLVMEAAVQACLPPLRESVARQQQAQTLLRASGEVPTTAQEILLRPASAYTSETPAEQLLRPGSSE